MTMACYTIIFGRRTIIGSYSGFRLMPQLPTVISNAKKETRFGVCAGLKTLFPEVRISDALGLCGDGYTLQV
jgi:hypothetical protein